MDVSPIEAKTGKARLHLSRAVSISIIGIFAILLVGALYFARGFFLPVMLSLLVTLTFSPTVRYLRHRGIPSVVSAVLIVLAMFAVFGSSAVYLADPISQVIADAPAITDIAVAAMAPPVRARELTVTPTLPATMLLAILGMSRIAAA